MKSLIVASLIGLSAGHFGLGSVDTDLNQAERNAENRPVPTTTLQLAGASQRSGEANLAIQASVDQAADDIDDAFGKAPNVATAMARSINEHGVVRAILYEDPQVKSATDDFAASLGRGLRAIGDAIARDMIEGTKQLHPVQRG